MVHKQFLLELYPESSVAFTPPKRVKTRDGNNSISRSLHRVDSHDTIISSSFNQRPPIKSHRVNSDRRHKAALQITDSNLGGCFLRKMLARAVPVYKVKNQ